MKKLSIYLLSALCIALVSSCNLFEDIDNMTPKGFLREKDLIVDEPSATMAKFGVYSSIRSERISALYTLLEMSTGVLSPSSIADQGSFSQSNFKEDGTTIDQVYTILYKGINAANYFLAHSEKAIKGLTPEQQASYRGEVLFLRALTNFRLLRLFGEYWNSKSANGIVLFTEPNRSEEKKARATVEDTFALIIADLELAIKDLLPTDQNGLPITKNFVTPLAAKALLAKVYLYKGNWAKALEYCNSVINEAPNSGIMLETDYPDIFDKESISSELIFVVKGMELEIQSTLEPNYIRPGETLIALADAVNPAPADPNTLSGYDARYSTTRNEGSIDKYKMKVFGGQGYQSGLIELRLGEMYLIRSEAAFRMGNIAQAQADLQVVLDRATGYAPDYAAKIPQNEFLERLFEQKILELFAEAGESYFSAQRRHFVDKIPLKNFFANTNHYMLPIPYAALQGNPALTQNPTYSK